MATYVPNATDSTQPTEDKQVVSAALEFRTLKTSVNSNISGLQTTAALLDTRVGAIETTFSSLGAGGQAGIVYIQQFSGTGAQVSFTMAIAPASTSVVDIYVNGLYQQKAAFSVHDTTLTFSVPPPAGTNNIEAKIYVTTAAVAAFTDIDHQVELAQDAASDAHDSALSAFDNAELVSGYLTTMSPVIVSIDAILDVQNNLANVDTVASSIASVNSAATNMAAILDAPTQASNAATSASNALTSETNAANSETNAATSASNAATSASNAETSASTATTQAGIATTQAGIASDNAGTASSAAANALAIYGSASAQQAAVTTAQAQANLAAGYAASASSVVQQDLSGVTAQALHRSPNAVTAMFVYDTSKDSDGGAWTDKCQHTSWYNEPLAGNWLGAQVSEANARAVPAATTGDYFQLTTDGKFYRLRKNLFSRSSEFDNSYWLKSGATITVDSTAAPDGSLTADTLIETAATGIHLFNSTCTVFPGQPITISVYAKAAGRTALTLKPNNTENNDVATFDLSNGTVGYVDAGLVAAITPVENGFYRCSVTEVYAGSSASIFFSLSNSSTSTGITSYTGDGVSGVYLWGAQLELGSTATTYEPKTSDGSITEIFRGNKAKFPKVAGIVAEATNTTIYDLTEPGRPMWMRFRAFRDYSSKTIHDAWAISWGSGGGIGTQSCAALDGAMIIGQNQSSPSPDYGGGLYYFDFAKDTAYSRQGLYALPGGRTVVGGISKFNNSTLDVPNTLLPSAGNGVYSFAMTVLPDAPVDPVTGLKVPTIAVATNGGVSVIKHDGTVASSTDSWGGLTVDIGAEGIYAQRDGSAWYEWIGNPAKLTGSFTFSVVSNGTAPEWGTATGGISRRISRARLQRVGSNSNRVQLLRNHEQTPTKGIGAAVTNTFNTGHMIGDIRRAYLADSVVGSVVNPATQPDRSYKAASATVYGTLDKSLSATGNQLVAYSGFSATDYLREPYSADLDFGTGEWSVSSWVNVPVSLPITMPTVGPELLINSTFDTDASGWTATDCTASVTGGILTLTPLPVYGTVSQVVATIPGRIYRLRLDLINYSSTFAPVSASPTSMTGVSYAYAPQEIQFVALSTATTISIITHSAFGASPQISAISLTESTPVAIVDRSFTSGPFVSVGLLNTHLGESYSKNAYLTATAYDGTTTRTVITTSAYNTATWLKAEACYTTDGTLSILVNGVKVASTYGNPLLTLNNASAPLTIGNSYALDAPFPGSLALLKLSATVPTAEQSLWMYEQEKQLFRDGAQCLLPDSGTIKDLSYDDATDKWIAVSTTNESSWTGLVRTDVTAVPSGTYSHIAANSGIKLESRITTNPGVDITIPAYGLREELFKKAEAVARMNQDIVTFGYVGGFTATTAIGNTAITSVAGLSYPSTVNLVGATVTGTGIPASTVIQAINGTTIYLSKAATAAGTTVQISLTDFPLPTGYETKAAMVTGTLKQEGSTKDFTRLFDGFKETVRFAVAPGYTAWVQVQAMKTI